MSNRMNNIKILPNYDLSGLNTFRLHSIAKYFIILDDRALLDTIANYINESGCAYFILGGGSNIILPEYLDGLVIYNALGGIDLIDASNNNILVRVGAGVNWDDFVAYSLEKGWNGLENLSGIPGMVGATVIQNVGAYGVEVAQFINSVEVYDIFTKKIIVISQNQCDFAYRFSIFKERREYIVIAVNFNLKSIVEPNLAYKDLQILANKNEDNLTAGKIREFVLKIRSVKLPDVRQIGNVGSFFKNPIVSVDEVERLLKKYPHLPNFPYNDNMVKISAGWMIDYSGLKGFRVGKVGVYEKQALVLVNLGNATIAELKELVRFIQERIYSCFGVTLLVEPDFLGKIKNAYFVDQ